MRLFPVIAAICCVSPLMAEDHAYEGVDLTLVSEKAEIAPGETFTVGLKIHHQPKYHTYWQNPGIAGMATTLEWALPPGFTAGAIRWPVPERTKMAIHPVHGYERDIVLLVDLTAPKTLTVGSKVELKAKAEWMACADGCHPGEQSFAMEKMVSATPKDDPNGKEEIAQARKEQPQPLQGWQARVDSAAGAAEIHLHLEPAAGTTPVKPDDLYFFSSDGQVSSDQPQKVTIAADGAIDLVVPRSEYSPKDCATVPGVLLAKTPLTQGGPVFASIEPAYSAGSSKGEAEAKK